VVFVIVICVTVIKKMTLNESIIIDFDSVLTQNWTHTVKCVLCGQPGHPPGQGGVSASGRCIQHI